MTLDIHKNNNDMNINIHIDINMDINIHLFVNMGREPQAQPTASHRTCFKSWTCPFERKLSFRRYVVNSCQHLGHIQQYLSTFFNIRSHIDALYVFSQNMLCWSAITAYVLDWGGDTSGCYTKPQKIIQSRDRLYKAQKRLYKAPQGLCKTQEY